MTRRTKREEEWVLEGLEQRESLRAAAQTVDCPAPPFGCQQPTGKPCVNRVGEPLRHMDHASRLTRAQAAKDRP
ncbi:hypothetical protein LWC34_38950 [Kibdelosporangium philippinense]|uniref:DNA-binding phage zinc finger domain-containing protein n=1 Tax=Kibdelosporangium philippinense TaxID=211113 RepID=A0ABS8ZLV3_9PSEU|nr:hypothetical protein [Kibdelosporangium philippinense]MCE7008749.1 hypothetical protein [Kibdelosporangium philippinense]